MSTIKGDPELIAQAGKTMRQTASEIQSAGRDCGLALRNLQTQSWAIAQFMDEPSAEGAATMVGQVSANIGGGLDSFAGRMHVLGPWVDPPLVAEGGMEDQFFTLPTTLLPSVGLEEEALRRLGPGYVPVETFAGPALRNESNGRTYLRGSDGQWYLLDLPSDVSGEGYSVVGQSEALIDTGNTPDSLERFARVLANGLGPVPAGPDAYAWLHFDGLGTDPRITQEQNNALASGARGSATYGIPEAPDGPSTSYSPGAIRNDVPTAPSPGRNEFVPTGAQNAGYMATGVSALGLAEQAASGYLNENGKYTAVRTTFSTDGQGNRRVVVQGATLTGYGDSMTVNPYSITGFDAQGEPEVVDALTVPFGQTEMAGCLGDDGSAGGSTSSAPRLDGKVP